MTVCVPEDSHLIGFGEGVYGAGLYGDQTPESDNSPAPASTGTAWERAWRQGGGRPHAVLTALLGGEEHVLPLDGGGVEVTQGLDKPRWRAAVTLVRDPLGDDIEQIVTHPQTLFRLEAGWRYPGDRTVMIPYGV